MGERITFVGDIMCEPRMLRAAEKENGYDFSGVFEQIRPMFEASDHAVGNLETPLAGEAAGYTAGLFSFNAPDAFADAVKDAGILTVTAANNHCLDRGLDGLVRTAGVLREKGLGFAGISDDPDRRNGVCFFSAGECRIAVVSYTYGTNYSDNRICLKEEEKNAVCLLRPQPERYFTAEKRRPSPAERIVSRLTASLDYEKRCRIKKALHLPYNRAHEDNFLDRSTADPFLEKMTEDIRNARKEADLVVFFPHTGGQFNENPGAFTEYVFDRAVEAGCDVILASHPHVVQKAARKGRVPCFYSLGNFSMSPNSAYLLHENLPEYGLAVHLYTEEKKLRKCTFSVLKMVEEENGILCVWPVDRLADTVSGKKRENLLRDVSEIVSRVLGTQLREETIRAEYDFEFLS